MAVKNKTQSVSSAGRRFFFGTNVTVVILLVVFVVIALNWIGYAHNVRYDMSGGLSIYRLSERSKSILDKTTGDIRITTVYTSDDPESDRKKYLPDLQDLCREISEYKDNVKVEHLHSGNERAELRNRIVHKFESASVEYDKLVNQALQVWDEYEKAVAEPRQLLGHLLQGDSWLGGFSTLANIDVVIRKDLEDLSETRSEVNDLVKSEAVPMYDEANGKIRSTNNRLKKNLEDSQEWMKDMNQLVKVLSNPDSEFANQTKSKLNQMTALLAQLQKTVGNPSDVNVPEDPKPLLKEIAKEFNHLANWLFEESSRVQSFVEKNPAIKLHPKWTVQVQQAIFVTKMPLSVILANAAESLSNNAQSLKQILKQDVPKDQMQNVVRQLRSIVQQIEESLQPWKNNILAILNDGTKIDQESIQFLAKGGSGELFKDIIDKLQDVLNKIDDLPELELDEIAEGLKKDNIIVVEANEDVKVISFDDVWPFSDPMAGFSMQKEERRRIFDGDSAISSAILSMQSKNPDATIVLVAFEDTPPPQMRQMQPPRTGPIPLENLSTLKKKLTDMNFEVKEWNLAAEDAKKPEIETEKVIYAFLPPAPSDPMQQMRRNAPPQKEFGEKEIKLIREVLANKNSSAIFLAVWSPPRMSFGPMPPDSYPYNELLENDWGIKVYADYRVIRGEPDKKHVNHYAINVQEWSYLQLNSFTDHPIGKPLQARRMLMSGVCPVTKADKKVAGVDISTVLEIPDTAHNIWAENGDGIRRIFGELRSGKYNGLFTKNDSTSWEPPFSVILAGEKVIKEEKKAETQPADTQPAETKQKIVVMGTGISMADFYLTQRVPRFEGEKSRLVTDPPPKENLDLLLNTVYWLSGKENMIAAGPAKIPLIKEIKAETKTTLWLTTFAWAFVVLIAGGIVMMVRRK